MILCQCGCGMPVFKDANKYILGHTQRGRKRTEQQKSNYRQAWTKDRKLHLSERLRSHNPMKNEVSKSKLRGENNPAKRPDVRQKISQNNGMKSSTTISKIINSLGFKNNIEVSANRWRKNNPAKNLSLLEKRIDTYTTRLANGEYQIRNKWKTGWFHKKDGTKEWFDSSFEKVQMERYEKLGVQWTKKHKIRIPYITKTGIQTYYVPDFLIFDKNILVLEEIKGWKKEGDVLKANIAIDYCKKNNMLYRFYLGSPLTLQPELSFEG